MSSFVINEIYFVLVLWIYILGHDRLGCGFWKGGGLQRNS